MPRYIDQVEEFHKTFGHPVGSTGEETLETRQLRIKLLFEELKELAEASDCRQTLSNCCAQFTFDQDTGAFIAYKDGDQVDLVAELDALCDLQVVLSGKIITSGHYVYFDEAFEEVHRSNMSKALPIPEDYRENFPEDYMKNSDFNRAVDGWIDALERAKGVKVKSELSKDGKYVIFLREDGKILKGPAFEEPNLAKFIDFFK